MHIKVLCNSIWCFLRLLTLILGLLVVQLGVAAGNVESSDKDLSQPPKTKKCFGEQDRYRFLADQWRTESDDAWRHSLFNFANAFGWALDTALSNRIDSAEIIIGETKNKMRVLFYANSGELVWERHHDAQMKKCGLDQSSFVMRGLLAGDGARENYINLIQLSRINEGIRIESKFHRSSSFLFFSTESQQSYAAEFKRANK